MSSSGLPPSLLEILRTADRFSRARKTRLFLVGGAVRDLLEGWAVRDLDLVWLGDTPPEEWSRGLATALRATAFRYHRQFLTAALELPGPELVDLGRARNESYSEPGSLPVVEPGDLEDDLWRRDFSVNALALPVASLLSGADWPEALVDPTGGRGDLAAKRLRILHRDSFRDDPTRMLRGVDLVARFDFSWSAETEIGLQEAVAERCLDTVSSARVRAEVERMFAEPVRALAAARCLAKHGLDRALSPDFRVASPDLDLLARLERWPQGSSYWLAACCALTWRATEPARRAIAERLALESGLREALVHAPTRLQGFLEPAAVDSGIMRRQLSQLGDFERDLLRGLGDARLCEALASFERTAGVALTISGNDLVAHGYVPGPDLGAALAATLEARREEKIGAAEELPFALSWLERHGKRPAAS